MLSAVRIVAPNDSIAIANPHMIKLNSSLNPDRSPAMYPFESG